MTAVFVACTRLPVGGSGVSSGSVTSTAGNALIMLATGYYTGTVGSPSLTASGGGTWVTDGTDNQHFTSTNDNFVLGFASCASATGGTQTITCTFPSTVGAQAYVYEFSGMAPANSMLDTLGTGAQVSANPLATSSLTNANANAVFMAVGFTYASANVTYGSPTNSWTTPTNGSDGNSTDNTTVTAYKIVSTVASDSTGWTVSASEKGSTFIAVYKQLWLPSGLGPDMTPDFSLGSGANLR